MSKSTELEPRIYVACLAAYNNGKLHGAWLDATDADDIREGIAAMLKASPEPGAEEWAIHDHEGFGGMHVGENPDLDKLAELAACISEHGEAFCAYASNVGYEHADAEGFQECYQGEFRSEEEFAEQLAEDIGAVDRNATWPNNHIDWEAAARDLFCGDYYMIDGHVFRSN